MEVRLDIEPIPDGLIVKVCASRVDAAAALAFRDACDTTPPKPTVRGSF